MGRLAKISFKETFQRKNGCKRSFLPCLRLCLCDSCNKPTVPTNNEVPTNQVPTWAPNSPNQVPTNATSYWRISPDNEVPTNSPNQVPTNATSSWRISQDNEVPTDLPNQVPTNATCSWRISPDNEVPTDPPNQVPTNDTSSWRISQDNEVPTDPPNQVPTNDQVPTSSSSSSWRISHVTLRMHQPLPWETQCIQGRPGHPLWAPGTRGLLRRLQR